jgi:hypothetical protein
MLWIGLLSTKMNRSKLEEGLWLFLNIHLPLLFTVNWILGWFKILDGVCLVNVSWLPIGQHD